MEYWIIGKNQSGIQRKLSMNTISLKKFNLVRNLRLNKQSVLFWPNRRIALLSSDLTQHSKTPLLQYSLTHLFNYN